MWREFLSNSHSSLNNAEIHSNLPEIAISEPTQRHDNDAEQLVTDCNGDDGWCEVEERTSGVTDTLLQEPDMTENVKTKSVRVLGSARTKIPQCSANYAWNEEHELLFLRKMHKML